MRTILASILLALAFPVSDSFGFELQDPNGVLDGLDKDFVDLSVTQYVDSIKVGDTALALLNDCNPVYGSPQLQLSCGGANEYQMWVTRSATADQSAELVVRSPYARPTYVPMPSGYVLGTKFFNVSLSFDFTLGKKFEFVAQSVSNESVTIAGNQYAGKRVRGLLTSFDATTARIYDTPADFLVIDNRKAGTAWMRVAEINAGSMRVFRLLKYQLEAMP
jgi:hypothetical protein